MGAAGQEPEDDLGDILGHVAAAYAHQSRRVDEMGVALHQAPEGILGTATDELA